MITIFVDDLNIFTPQNTQIMARVKAELSAAFDMVDMGPLAYVLLR